MSEPSSPRRGVVGRVRMIGLMTLLSRILGFIRDSVMGAQFGRGSILDQFAVAFRIPNLARQLFGEGALSTAFLPVFLRDLEHNGRETAFRTASAVIFATAVSLLAVVLAAEAVILLLLYFGSFNYEGHLLLQLMAILTPFLMLICVLAQACAVMHGLGEFFGPAQFPVFFNAVWIAITWGLGQTSLEAETRIRLISATIVAEGCVQLAMSVPTLRRLGFRFDLNWSASKDRVFEVTRTMLPVLVGLSIMQLNTLSDSLFAWAFTAPKDGVEGWLSYYPLTAGTVVDLYYGQRLLQFPIGVFGTALGTVIFPVLTLHAERRQMDLFRDDLTHGLRLVAAIAVPASVGMWLVAEPLVYVLFRHGEFAESDVLKTSNVVAMYAFGIWSACGLLIVQRAFYALGDRMTPLRIGLWSVGINLVANMTLIWPLGGPGLALSTSICSIFQCLLTAAALQRKTQGIDWPRLSLGLGQTVVASIAMALGCLATKWGLAQAQLPDGFLGQLIHLMLSIVVGVGTYLLCAKLLGLDEPWELLRRRRGPRNAQPAE